ncbi:hypothetical protein M758_11G068700 [Ceratodon purpureus]|nr:hypothetical protein M758_11G068700 [Ceratodon purpureus]
MHRTVRHRSGLLFQVIVSLLSADFSYCFRQQNWRAYLVDDAPKYLHTVQLQCT